MSQANDSFKLNILFYTDVHGHFLSDVDGGLRPNGLDRMVTYAKKLKKKGENLLIIDNGDSIQGNHLVDLFNYNSPQCRTLKHPLTILHEELGVSCFIPGNHDFNFGLRHLEKLQEESEIPWLAANIYTQSTKSPFFTPYHIFTFGLYKVGVLGFTTEFVPRWEDKTSIPDLDFRNVIKEASHWIGELEEKCDFLVVSYHGGLDKNPETGKPISNHMDSENQGFELWQMFPEIDLLLLGHQHRKFSYFPNDHERAPVIQGGSKGQMWSHITLSAEEGKRYGSTGHKLSIDKVEFIESHTVSPDPELKKRLLPHLKRNQDILDMHLGFAEKCFTIKNPLEDVWLKKHAYIQWIQELMCQASGCDISSISLLDPDLKGLPKKVTMRDILENYHFINTISVLQISGKTLKSALEKGASFFCLQKENGKNSIKVHPEWDTYKVRSYDFDMWYGIDYGFNISRPIGSRLAWLKYKGEDVEDEDLLKVVMTTYRAGGAFYDMFSPDLVITDFPAKISDLMIDDILHKKHLHVDIKQNFKVFFDEDE